MSRLSSFVFFWLISAAIAGGQCTDCKGVTTDQPDYCFIHPEFEGKCVAFLAGQNYCYLDENGKAVRIEMAAEGQTPVGWLIEVSKNKKYKADGSDILFLERAIEKWRSAERAVGMLSTPSGLQYKFLTKTEGKMPAAGKKVFVHYKGTLEDGTVFDNSYDRGQPFSFVLGTSQVIKGWDEGIQLFPVGSKGLLRIPPALGYGAHGAGGVIPPNATLYFEIEVMSAD